jgi:hypothetical protein
MIPTKCHSTAVLVPAAFALVLLVYCVGYIFWRNSVAFNDGMGNRSMHAGLTPAMHPKMWTLFFPMILLDAKFGRLYLAVG